jgi:hypothetical protein
MENKEDIQERIDAINVRIGELKEKLKFWQRMEVVLLVLNLLMLAVNIGVAIHENQEEGVPSYRFFAIACSAFASGFLTASIYFRKAE